MNRITGENVAYEAPKMTLIEFVPEGLVCSMSDFDNEGFEDEYDDDIW